MEFVKARESHRIPAVYAWCVAVSESLASVKEFPTFGPIAGDVVRMRLALDMSKFGLACLAIGVFVMALGFPDGTFLAGVGCLLFAIAGIRLRLINWRRSRLIRWR